MYIQVLSIADIRWEGVWYLDLMIMPHTQNSKRHEYNENVIRLCLKKKTPPQWIHNNKISLLYTVLTNILNHLLSHSRRVLMHRCMCAYGVIYRDAVRTLRNTQTVGFLYVSRFTLYSITSNLVIHRI